ASGVAALRSSCPRWDARSSGGIEAFNAAPTFASADARVGGLFAYCGMCGFRATVHQVQTNLPTANATTHPIRTKKIETAKLACFLNSLSPSLIRVVRWKKTARMKRNSGIAAATKAMILIIIVDPC